VKKIDKAYRLSSSKRRRFRRTAEILWFSARLDPWNDHRLMIPKECPLARIPNFPITTQSPRGEGWEGVIIFGCGFAALCPLGFHILILSASVTGQPRLYCGYFFKELGRPVRIENPAGAMPAQFFGGGLGRLFALFDFLNHGGYQFRGNQGMAAHGMNL